MEEEIDSSVIKATQVSLGKYVKRPPLSDKLLKKPPFRFLHDIVTSILKSKGFFEGLFDENELTSDNVKDRDSKITFLNKVISVVSLTTGESLSVKPSKIVAGQEPTKTNELLQTLARALDRNLSSDTAVKQFKTGEKISTNSDKKTKEPLKPVKKNTDLKKLTSKSNEKLINNDKNTQNMKSKHKLHEGTISKKDSPPKRPASKVSNKKPSEKLKQEPALQHNDPLQEKSKRTDTKTNVLDEKLVDNIEQNTSNDENIAVDKNLSLDEKTTQPDTKQESLSSSFISDQENQLGEVNISDSQISNNDNFSSIFKDPVLVGDEIAKKEVFNEGLLIKPVKNEINNEEEHKKIMHEGNTGVNEDFKVNLVENRYINVDTEDKNNSTVPVRPPSVRPSSSRPGAPRLREKSDSMISDSENIVVGKVNIISETTLQEEEDEDTTIIVEDQTTGELQEMLQNQERNNENSHLVQQILDSQKEYTQVSGKTEIEWQFGVQKTSDVFIQEMEQLKFNVQALSRIANPLGKLLDHIQEDVEVMRQELQQWTKLYEETSKDLIKQKTANEELLLPFHTKLKQLKTDISEKQEKITDLKVSIHKNTARIEKLLASGNVQ